MNLRPPPSPERTALREKRRLQAQIFQFGAMVVIIAMIWFFVRPVLSANSSSFDASLDREVASKLKAAGLLDQAAARYEPVLRSGQLEPAAHAGIAFSLGEAYLANGETESALRWLYEAESVGEAPAEVSAKIVHALEQLGRVNEARAVLASRSQLSDEQDPATHSSDDPVAARVGDATIYASEVRRALDQLPPQLKAHFSEAKGQASFLEKMVADEIIWQKAARLELDKDAGLQKQALEASRQIVIAAFIERELQAKITIDEVDIKSYHQANADKYSKDGQSLDFETARPRVERELRQAKLEAAYSNLLQQEMSSGTIQIHPQALKQ